MALFSDSIEGVLRNNKIQTARNKSNIYNAQDGVEAFLVDGHLDGHMREVIIHQLVRKGFDGRVVLRVLVVMSDRTDSHAEVLEDLQAEEEGDRKQERDDCAQRKAGEVVVQLPLNQEGVDTVTNKDCVRA